MNIYPFFIECSKYYSDQPHKQKLLQQFAFGKGGGFIIKRKDKDILVTSDGEFTIPTEYSDESRFELDKKLWKMDDFEQMQLDIKNMRSLWSTTKKKDKLYLFYKYIAKLNLSLFEKVLLCNLITLTLLLKLVKPSDIIYKNYVLENINDNLLKTDTIKNIDFSYDYSSPNKALNEVNAVGADVKKTTDDDDDED